MLLEVDQIQTQDLQARVGTDENTIAEYAEAMNRGEDFPPVVVYHDGREYYLADGFHRLLAKVRNGAPLIDCQIKKGGRDDARWHSAGSNIDHGLKRTNADKRRAVEIALELRPSMADRAIADYCKVSDWLVSQCRQVQKHAPQVQVQAPVGKPYTPPPPTKKRTGKDGKAYPSTPKAVELDGVGREIPETLLPLWRRRSEINEHLSALSRLRVSIRSAEGDPLWAEVNTSALLANIDAAYTSVKTAVRHAVCPTCQGIMTTGCKLCFGTGLISEFRWERTVPQETKDLILKNL